MVPGTKLPLDLVRGGKAQALTVTVGELKQTGAEATPPESEEAAPDTTGFGMGVQTLTPEQARALDIPAGRGVLVALGDAPTARPPRRVCVKATSSRKWTARR